MCRQLHFNLNRSYFNVIVLKLLVDKYVFLELVKIMQMCAVLIFVFVLISANTYRL